MHTILPNLFIKIKNVKSQNLESIIRPETSSKWFSSKVNSEKKGTAMQPLPIGYDNFRDVINHKLTYVDKSLFIKDFLDDRASQVSLITRPRRFGKTLNMSMLHHFFASKVNGEDTKDLFAGLEIMQQGKEYLQHQGKYPVISLSFKDIKGDDFQSSYANLRKLLSGTFGEYEFLLDSPKILSHKKRNFEAVLTRKADETQIKSALLDLTSSLHQHYGKKVIILIDEYDTLIQTGYARGYYDQSINIMRHLLGAGLKGNPYLYRAMLTGILRISKESLFSGLNNLEVYSTIRPEYSQYFGFTEKEVSDLLEKSNLKAQSKEIRKWYNGYKIGNTTIYNPWSIANCIKRKGALEPYWVNTSDNILVRDLLVNSSAKFKHDFELLLNGHTINKIIDENFVFSELKKNEANIWNLLLMTGYLKIVSSETTPQGTLCQLEIPNLEIRYLYRNIIETWLSNGKGLEWYNEFLDNLLTGNMQEFRENLDNILLQTVSTHDTARHSENFYQGLVLGLVASLDKKDYEIKSNRESGYGRYDIVIIPKDTSKLAIIFELKSIKNLDKKEKTEALLKREAQQALTQINKNKYTAEFEQRGLNNILKIGLAFSGKEFYLESSHEPGLFLEIKSS